MILLGGLSITGNAWGALYECSTDGCIHGSLHLKHPETQVIPILIVWVNPVRYFGLLGLWFIYMSSSVYMSNMCFWRFALIQNSLCKTQCNPTCHKPSLRENAIPSSQNSCKIYIGLWKLAAGKSAVNLGKNMQTVTSKLAQDYNLSRQWVEPMCRKRCQVS